MLRARTPVAGRVPQEHPTHQPRVKMPVLRKMNSCIGSSLLGSEVERVGSVATAVAGAPVCHDGGAAIGRALVVGGGHVLVVVPLAVSALAERTALPD